MITSTIPTTAADLADLAAALTGGLLLPGTSRYAELARPWNTAVPARPLAVAAVADAADVQACIRWAARRGVPVAVRATGHGAVEALDGVLLIHTGRLQEVTVSPDGSARVGAGVTWGALAAEAAHHGFAPLGGSAPTVGVVGLLTGGGLGPLSRTHGVCSDRVAAFELVTGDGRLRRVATDQEPELFWGLRGGKGGLGVVTAVEVGLLPDALLLAGALFFDGSDAAAVLRAWARWCPDLPDEATTSIALLRLPAVPGIPQPIAGRLTVAVRFAWTGDEQAGRRLLDPVLDAAPVIFGGVQPMPAAAVGAIHGDPVDPTPSLERSVMLHGLPDEAVESLLAAAGPGADCSLLVVEVRQLGGRIARSPSAPDAFPGRDVAFSLLAIGIAAGPMAAVTGRDAAAVAETAQPWAVRRRLPNFEPTVDPGDLVATYGAETIARLAGLADRVDPSGIVHAARAVRQARDALDR